MNTVEFYTSLLSSVGLVIDANGTVMKPDGKSAYKVDSKELVLPTNAMLDENEWSKRHPFHPLCEDALLGQSPTIRWLTKVVRAYIIEHLCSTMTLILDVASKPTLQEEVKDPKAHDILVHAKNARDKTLAAWKDIENAIKSGTIDPVSIYLSRSNPGTDAKFFRTCTVSMDILADKTNDAYIMGINCKTKGDKLAIVELLEYLVDGVELEVGSVDASPYFHSLVSMLAQFMTKFNKIYKIFRKVSPVKPADAAWIKEIDNLKQFFGRIPTLPGNEGEKPKKVKAKVTTEEPKALNVLGDIVEERAANDTPPWNEEKVVEIAKIAEAGPAKPTERVRLTDFLGSNKPTIERSGRDESIRDRLGFAREDRDSRFERREERRDRFSRDDRYDRGGRDRGYDDRDDRRSSSRSFSVSDIIGAGRRR